MAEPNAAEEWRLERYKDGDEDGLLALFQAVFGKSRSREHWTWQFRNNPYGGPFVSLARRVRDGAVVGSYSVMPVQLNIVGRAVPACQSVDTAVHAEFRGQRIFEKTASDCYAWCASAGLQAVIGFPNANSYPGFMRSLAWKRIVFPTFHVYRLSMRIGLRRLAGSDWLAAVADGFYQVIVGLRLDARHALLARLAGPGTRFQVTDRVPEGYEKLWSAWKNQEVLSVWKDTKYFAWRYDQNPSQRFRYFWLERGGEIVALAVGAEIDGALALCELMVGGRDVAAGRLLANEICRHALARDLRAVNFLGHDAGLFHEVLETFEHNPSFTNVFGGRALAVGAIAEDLPHAANWTVTFGDGDFV